MYGQSRKDVFLTLLSVQSNLATLNLETAVMQRETSTWVDFYISLRLSFPFIYIIRCTPQLRCTLFAYICEGRSPWIHKSVVLSFRHSGIDQAVVCVYIIAGVGRLHVAYPQVGAMRRPGVRDKRGSIHSPTSFLFP